MIGIVFATRREADPFLNGTLAERFADGPLPLFQTRLDGLASSTVVIGGMGKVAAALAAAHLVRELGARVMINAGLCGCLATGCSWTAGDLLRISTAVEGDCDRFGCAEPAVACDPRWFGQLPPARLVTCDRPIFDSAQRACLAGSGELADMEGAAVARAARFYGISCAMVKGISDAADESGRQQVADNIDWLSARIADVLIQELMLNLTDRLP